MMLDPAEYAATAPTDRRRRKLTSTGPPATKCPADLAMERYADGDDSAFLPLFWELSPRLRAFLRHLTGSPELAEDLLQETFLRIHSARSGFVKGRGVAQWAYAIARNGYASQCRSTRTSLAHASEGTEALESVAGSEGTGEQQAVARQTAQVVERALLGMTPVQRESFVLLRCEHLSVAKAAERIGASRSAVKIRLFRATGAIRQALTALASEPTE